MLGDKNPAKAGAAMSAMLKMRKISIKDLKEAYDRA
jgi:predicted 3-demethylubiquinone-9 3-methyltransferase (glyoxalase superfamily)